MGEKEAGVNSVQRPEFHQRCRCIFSVWFAVVETMGISSEDSDHVVACHT